MSTILNAAKDLVIEQDVTPTDNPVNITPTEVKRRYDAWNKRLFGGSLPEIDIKVTRLKGSSGKTIANYTAKKNAVPRSNSRLAQIMDQAGIKNDVQINKITMQINNGMKLTSQQLDETIIHEMIHVKLFSSGFINHGHGPQFEALRKELSSKVGFEIPTTHDLAELKLNDGTKAKDLLAMINKNDYVIFFHPSLEEQVKNWMERVNSLSGFVLYRLKTTLGEKYSVKRTIPRGAFDIIGIKPEEIEHIRKNGMVVYEKSSKPLAQMSGGTQRKTA